MTSTGSIGSKLCRLALLALAVPTLAAAQNAAVFARVSGPEGPIASASVELLSSDAVSRSTVTDSAGVARLVGLPAGTYSVRVVAIGHRTRTIEGIVLTSGQVRVVDVELALAPVQLDEIAVRTDRIQIQRENTEFSTMVGEVAIELLPVAYDAAQLVALTPGARAGHVWGGANFQANSYQIDGLSANHPGLGGSAIEPSTTWIERIEVRGLGSGAEHGGFQGGQVNVVTKTGTNDFSAMLRTGVENDFLTASNLVSTEIGSEVADRYDVEGEIQGPLIRDRLFYYLAGTWVDRNARVLNHLNSVEGKYAPMLEQRTEQKVFGKLTWTPWTADEIELSGAFLNTHADNYGMTGFEAEGAATEYSAPTWFANLAWRHSLGDWGNIEARVNHFARDQRQEPYHGADRPGVQFFAVVPPYTRFHNAPFSLRSAPSSTSATLLNTFRLRTGEQEHILTIGGEYTRGSFLDQRIRNGGMTWLPVRTASFDATDPSTWRHQSASWTPTEWGGEVRLNADVVNAAAFAQASISLGRVVLSPGVRWGLWEGWMDPNEGARFRAVADQAIDPRIGATVELTEDGSMVLKGHWGRYHQSMIAQMFDRAAGTDVFSNQEVWYYRGDPPTDPLHRFTRAERDALAAQGLFTRESVISLNETGPVVDYDQPYIDQWLVGFEKEFGSAKIEMLYTRRSNRDMVALVDRNRATNYYRYDRVRVYDASGMPLSFQGGSVYLAGVYIPNNVLSDLLKYCVINPDVCALEPHLYPPDLTAADTLWLTWDPDYVLTNAPDAKREFQQFQFTVEVARPTWGGSFSVAFTGLEGNLDNVSGYADPEEYSPGPYVRVNEGVNAFGTLPNFSEREIKVSAWGQLPWNLRGGVFWTYASGDHYSPRFRLSGQGFYQYRVNVQAASGSSCCPYVGGDPGYSGDILYQGLLAAVEGQYVYVGPRGEPQLQRRSNVNLRLERLFELDGFELGVSMDLFNVLGLESITEVQTLVNNGQNYFDFLKGGSISGTPWSVTPGNEYYKAVLERVPPRTLRLGATVYF